MTTVAFKSFNARVESTGEFSARVFVVGGPPDGDGDVELDDNDGAKVQISGVERDHDSLAPPLGLGLEPAGDGRLVRVGNAVHVVGTTRDTARGRALRSSLLRAGPERQWSVGFDSVVARAPDAAEMKKWPDAQRIITRWRVFEAAPVVLGSCGPTCRTLGAKCAGGLGCGCGGSRLAPTRPPAAAGPGKEWISRTPGGEEIAATMVRKSYEFWEAKSAPPLVRFFLPKPGDNRMGVFFPDRPNEVWLSADLSREELPDVACHEARHAFQVNEQGKQFDAEWRLEGDAIWAARDVISRLQAQGYDL